MSHLQRILREQETTRAELDELKRQLAIVARQVQNIASDSFGGSIGESGGLYVRPGEIRAGKFIKLDRAGFLFNGRTIANVFFLDVTSDTVDFGTVLRVKERSDAMGDEATWAQLWVKNTSPQELWFTDEDGVDHQITSTGTGGTHMIEEKDALTIGESVTVAVA